MIAITICLRPSVIIADEPTTALDVTNQLQVLRQLKRIRSEYGTSILLISHDLGVISEMADEVAVMQHGRIVEKADVYQLFDHPQHEYTKELLDARPCRLTDQPTDQGVCHAMNDMMQSEIISQGRPFGVVTLLLILLLSKQGVKN